MQNCINKNESNEKPYILMGYLYYAKLHTEKLSEKLNTGHRSMTEKKMTF